MQIKTAIKEKLRDAGLHVTAGRLAVLAAVEESPHASADKIAEIARKKSGSLSTQAVYDNLHALVGAGLLRRIQPAGHSAMYETRLDDNHHHLVCRNCGLTMDVDCTLGEKPCLQPKSFYGFHIDEAEVTYWGLCPTCQPKQSVRRKSSPLIHNG